MGTLALPADVAGEAIAILAKRGAGKTNTGRVLVEELHGAGVLVVVLDPVGAWWGLRSSADGKSAGLPLPVLGGAHGDVPLQAAAGALLADVVVDTGQSLVLDLSDFSKTEQRRFVTDFAERLYTRKARDRSLLHLVLEEADEFAPQRVSAGDARMVGAIEQLVRRGRGRGIGLTMITQRSASLNKSILTQADVLFAMRTTGPQDRKAIEAWVEKQDVDGAEDVVPSLSSLATGEAWIWNPERGMLERIRIRLARTFDGSSTPKAGQQRTEPKNLAPIDLARLGAEIEATAERAKENDPGELRKKMRGLEDANRGLAGEIERLHRELAASATERGVEKIVEVEVPALSAAQIGRLENIAKELTTAASSTSQFASEILRGLGDVKAARAETAERREEARSAPEPAARPPARPPSPPTPRPAAVSRVSSSQGNGSVSGPQQRILNALAAFEAIGISDAHKTQLALFAQAAPKSSSFTNNLGHLHNQLGLICYPTPGRVALTPDGRELADASHAPPTSTDELHGFVYGLVGGAKTRLLEQLVAVYPDALTKQELADRAGASATSSSFTNNLGSLRSLGLIDYPGRGLVAALPVLFLEGA